MRPTTLGEGGDVKEFYRLLLQSCGATHMWNPPSHQRVSAILSQDLQEFEIRAARAMEKANPEWTIMHTDGWSDQWQRSWCGLIVRFLDESWTIRELCLGFEHAGVWASADAGSQHAAGPMATAVRAQLRHLRVQEPRWSHSDSSGAAVKVGKILDMHPIRCVVHILAIASQRTLWSHDRNPPAVVSMMAKCRGFALFLYKQEDLMIEFRKLGGGQVFPPKPDSHAKWSSSIAMVRRCIAANDSVWPLMYTKHGSKGRCPSALTVPELQLAKSTERGMDVVWYAVCNLQRDDALLAEYAPQTSALRAELRGHDSEFARTYVSELGGAEMRNLGPAPSIAFASGLDMCHLATLLHPRYRNGRHFDQERRDTLSELLGRFAIKGFVRT